MNTSDSENSLAQWKHFQTSGDFAAFLRNDNGPTGVHEASGGSRHGLGVGPSL